MKNIAISIFIVLIFSVQLTAQKKDWTVKSGEEINESLPASVRFLYPQFVSGNVYFRDGSVSGAPLNYNLLTGEMLFINLNNDTLALANEATIKFITINKDSFYYDKVYVELIVANSSVKLAKKEIIKLGDIKKVGGYGQSSSASAISNVSSLYNGHTITKLNANIDLLLIKETNYYMGDGFNHFLPAIKKI